MYEYRGEYPKAEKEVDTFRDTRLEVGFGERKTELRYRLHLGNVAVYQRDYESALSCLGKSLEISRELGDRRGEAATLGNLGVVASDQDDYESAHSYYEASLEISRKIGATRITLQTLNNLVITRRFMGDVESAIEWCRTALSIIDESDIDLTDERKMFEAYLDELQSSEENGR